MVFSPTIFLFGFLPAVLAAYFGLHPRLRNAWLLVASLALYAWGENRLYLRIDPRTLRGRLGIRPGFVLGNYRLYGLEIRAVDRVVSTSPGAK